MRTFKSKIDIEESIKKIEKKLYLSSFSILNNKEDTEDALQETIYIIYSKINQLKDFTNFNAWATRILINESYKIYNKRKSNVSFDNIDNIFSATTYKSDILFFDIVSNLKKHEKKVVILRFYNDFSIKEISQMLRIPLSTVKSRLYRALEKIKLQLEDQL